MENRCYGCMRIRKQRPRCEHCGYVEGKANELHQLPLGTILRDQYVVGRTLGQGGFGITYLGWDQYLENPVAIKEYYPGGQVSRNGLTTTVITCNTAPEQYREGCERFMREARTLSKLQDVGNIVKVAGFFKENNTAYIVMEYVRGITLLQYIKERGGKLTASETFAVLRPVMQALHRVHEAGMIHRDISPDNIMLQDSGTVKILDFGTARDIDVSGDGQMTHSTQAVLKYGFAPAEQYASGRAIDRRADEYALCATVYFCLTGQTPPDAFQRLMDGTPMDWDAVPGLTEKQRQVLAKGTAIKAEDRYPDLKALEEALFGVREEKEPVPPKKPATKKKQPKAELSRAQEAEIPQTAPMPVEGEAFPETVPMPETGYEEDTFAEDLPEGAEAGEKKKAEPWKRPKWLLSAIAAVAALVVLIVGGLWISRQSQEQNALKKQYRQAQSALEAGDYQKAYGMFSTLGDYEDSQIMCSEVRYRQAGNHLEKKEYEEAYSLYSDLAQQDYKDSKKLSEQLGQWEAFYRKADSQMESGNYATAYHLFLDLGDYKDSPARATEARYQQAAACMDKGEYDTALDIFTELGDYKDSKEKLEQLQKMEKDYQEACALMVAGNEREAYRRFGLLGNYKDSAAQAAMGSRIIQIAAGEGHTVGLKADGTVVATGENAWKQCDVSGWTDIIAISAHSKCTVGLKADGTAVAAGSNYHGQCEVSGWTDIIAVAAGGDYTVGLKADGTVVAVGSNNCGQCNVSGWKDIIAISAGQYHTVGLKADGTVVAVGDNSTMHDKDDSETGRCDVSGWKDIVAICAGSYHTVGVKADGSVVAVGWNEYGQCGISAWKDITAVSAGSYHTFGWKADGTVVAVGDNFLRKAQRNVSHWKDIVAVAAGRDHTVGLKADGTVVAIGSNEDGQCKVSGWNIKTK